MISLEKLAEYYDDYLDDYVDEILSDIQEEIDDSDIDELQTAEEYVAEYKDEMNDYASDDLYDVIDGYIYNMDVDIDTELDNCTGKQLRDAKKTASDFDYESPDDDMLMFFVIYNECIHKGLPSKMAKAKLEEITEYVRDRLDFKLGNVE